MIRPGFFSPMERLELEACVRSQREDHGIARRANALLLLDDGKSCQVIAEFLYLDDDTVRGWHKTYRENGWDALAVDGWKGGQSRMAADQEAALCDWLDGRFCHSSVEIRAHVSTKYGLRYSHSGCIKLHILRCFIVYSAFVRHIPYCFYRKMLCAVTTFARISRYCEL
jgi:transposase